MLESAELEAALETLGARLEELDRTVGILVIGGGSLLLLGVIDRPTADVDVVGVSSAHGYVAADHLPQFLTDAVREVGEALGLGPSWLNSGPAGLVAFGLPKGIETRVTVRTYGGLEVHLPAFEDLICFKLYATVDLTERSKHFNDLIALEPTRDQLLSAAQWTRTHDPSVGFRGELERILRLLGVEVQDGEL